MISFDYSDAGKNIKAQLLWLSLKDATTARSIISAIAGGEKILWQLKCAVMKIKYYG